MPNEKGKETKLCKYCQTEIPKKAKICPNCKKKQGGIVKWIVIAVVVLAIIGAAGGKDKKDNTNGTVQTQQTDVVDARKNESIKETDAFSDSDFSTKEYLYENTIGDSLYFVAITNNSNTDVSVSANATAKNSDGNSIGAGKMSIDIIGSGETSIGCIYFDSVTGIDKVDCKIKYSDSPNYKSVINSLSTEQTLNDNNVVLSVTNNSDSAARFVEVYALFLDSDNNVIYYDRNYITDDDSEIKPGDTISVQLDSYKEYDHVDIYYTGRAQK